MREWRQGVRKLLLLLYTASLLTSLGCFLWNASAPVRVHSAPKCYPSKGDGFTLAPLPTLPPDSILNTGDAAALDALPGIGTVLSERIITYREEHGAFVYPEDLRNVQGIGAELQTKITDSLDDESTNPLIAPAAETTAVPRATLPPDSIQHALEPNQSNRKMTLTVKELAEELNISRNTAYQLADQKDFPSFRIGRQLLINRAMLQEWLNQNASSKLCPT